MMCEARAGNIINTQPFTVYHLTDPDSLDSLTPNHQRTMKSQIVPSFLTADVYCRKRRKSVELNISRTISGLAIERSCTSSSSNARSASRIGQIKLRASMTRSSHLRQESLAKFVETGTCIMCSVPNFSNTNHRISTK